MLGIEEARRIMMEHFANAARRFGLSELYGYIYGVLFFTDEPLSLGEIAEKTGYSISHVSSALKLLESVGLVTRIKKPGDKKAYFTAIKNLKEWRKAAYYNKLLEDVRQTRINVQKALEEIKNDKSEEAKKIREKLKFMLKRNEITERIIKLLIKSDEENLLEKLILCLHELEKERA